MMKHSLVAGFVIVLSLVEIPNAGYAEFASAQSLKDNCRVTGSGLTRGLCRGFIVGAADTAEMNKVYCPPNNFTLNQLVDIVTKYLDDHPEYGHYSAASVVEHALKKVWPCQ